jgi:UDP-N-acetylglucosamine--N-acetylmuramyl-(pentapeptide) pyrophosphoryl-undecaprenol N-acetylglucosamine transferase
MWVFAPVQFVVSTIRAFRMLSRLEPTLVMTAGAYVSVPVAFAAAMMRVPVWVHQFDVVIGLANRIMAPLAAKVSVTWEQHIARFGIKKTLAVGAMIRPFLRLGDAQTAREVFGLSAEKPTVLVVGGGTGSTRMNERFLIIGPELLRHANVIHLTGRGKMLSALETLGDGYVAREFSGEGMADILALADVVVARAGMGTLAEIVGLGKASILLPLEGQQEANAKAMEDKGGAEVLKHVTPQTLLQSILRLLEQTDRREALAAKARTVFPTNGDERIVHEALRMLGENRS